MTQINNLFVDALNYLVQALITYVQTQSEWIIHNLKNPRSPSYVFLLIYLIAKIYLHVYDRKQ